MQVIERNDPCPCGSGKKYKKCCLGQLDPQADFTVEIPLRHSNAPEVREPGKVGVLVKVQWPIGYLPDQGAMAMVYDRERTFQKLIPATKELAAKLKGEIKAFFYASILEGELKLFEHAKWQEW
jgi:SEC-C motif